MDYRKLSIALGLVVAFLIGCVAHEVVAVAVPPARAGPAPARWDHVCVQAAANITPTLQRYGEEGWELAAAAGYGWGPGLFSERVMVWCFKRPLG
jgi:hypothetical protein